MQSVTAQGIKCCGSVAGAAQAKIGKTYDDVNFTPPLLGTITARTLIVFGDIDPLYPNRLAFELREAIPRSALWVVPGVGPVQFAHIECFGRDSWTSEESSGCLGSGEATSR
jgi:pimeloyl-ACP methyl ester carboxylesterase